MSFDQLKKPAHQTKGADLQHDLNLSFYDAIFGSNQEVQFHQLKIQPDGQIQSILKTLQLHVPPGVSSGKRLRISGQGNDSKNGGTPGDLYLELLVPSAADGFRRVGNDIL